MQDFISLFLNFTKDFETPTSFFKWAAYSVVGAILRDNVYVMQGTTKICPNLFVVLLAKSAGRKAQPVKLATKLVRASRHTKIVSGRCSIEAILDVLAEQTTDKETSAILSGGSCLLAAEELVSFFVGSDSLVPVLTDLYDYKEEWESRLRGTGGMGSNFKIRNLCVSLLAASNESHMRAIYQGMAIHGGLLGRTCLVSPDETRPPNALFFADDDVINNKTYHDFQVFDESIIALKKIKGPVRKDRDAADYYIKWYHSWHTFIQKKNDNTGILGRTHTNVLKLAMILGVAEEYTAIIKKQHIERAIVECTDILKNYEVFVMGTGKSTIQEAGTLILHDLWSAKDNKLSRGEILSNHWGQFDAEILDKLIVTFEQGGLIKSYINGVNTEYTMTDKCRAIFERKEPAN